jgi:hypothetical protein
MDSILLIVTLVSVAIAATLGAVIAKLLRDERRRSDARVAALTEMAETESWSEPAIVEAPARIQPRPATLQARPATLEPRIAVQTAGAHIRMSADDLELNQVEPVAPVGELFVQPERRSPWLPRLGVAAALVLVVTAIGFLAFSRARSGGAAIEATAVEPAAAQAPARSLELLSLTHQQQVEALTISGLVQNPRDGLPLSKITVTAFLFAADGSFLASGRAPLDFTVLRPGDESPFVISVPVQRPVARYRVGFRDEEGRIIGHVDRRAGGTMARSSG